MSAGEHQTGLDGASGDTQRDAVPAGPRDQRRLLHPHLQDKRARSGEIVQENPYRLAQDVRGIGFITADKIARQTGIDEHSPHRARAALEYLLLERADEGHFFSPNAELVQMCRSRFDLPRSC